MIFYFGKNAMTSSLPSNTPVSQPKISYRPPSRFAHRLDGVSDGVSVLVIRNNRVLKHHRQKGRRINIVRAHSFPTLLGRFYIQVGEIMNFSMRILASVLPCQIFIWALMEFTYSLCYGHDMTQGQVFSRCHPSALLGVVPKIA